MVYANPVDRLHNGLECIGHRERVQRCIERHLKLEPSRAISEQC